MEVSKLYKLATITISSRNRELRYALDGYTYSLDGELKSYDVISVEKYFKVIDKYCGKRKKGYNEPMIITRVENI